MKNIILATAMTLLGVGIWFASDEKSPMAPKPEPAPAGYFELQSGIYGKWCDDCSQDSKIFDDERIVALEVWCRDVACGDVYAEVNFEKDKVTVDYSNDILTLGKGDRGILTFSTRRADANSYYLVDFSAYGF